MSLIDSRQEAVPSRGSAGPEAGSAETAPTS